MSCMSKHARKEWLYLRGFGGSVPNKFGSAWKYCADKLNLKLIKDENGRVGLKKIPTRQGKPLSLMDIVKLADGDSKVQFDICDTTIVGKALAKVETGNVLFHKLLALWENENYWVLDTDENAQAILEFCQMATRFPSQLVVPVCPNWSTDETGKFDFKGCDYGNSMVGKRAIHYIKKLNKFFSNLGYNLQVKVYIGDYEGRRADLQRKFHLSEKGFYARFNSTLVAIERELTEAGVDVEVGYLTEIAGQYSVWSHRLQHNIEKTQDKTIAELLNCSNKGQRRYLSERKNLFVRVLGDIDIEEACKVQLAEYATIAEVVRRKFENPLLLGCDVISTAYGYACLGESVPVIYTPKSRIYY